MPKLSQLFMTPQQGRQLIASGMEVLGTQRRLPAIQEAFDSGKPFDVRRLVAQNRMAYNEAYYANLPQYSAMTVEDTRQFQFGTGELRQTNFNVKRPDIKLEYSKDIIEKLMTRYLKSEIVKSIKNDLYRSPRFTSMNKGAGGPIEVSLKDADGHWYSSRLVITVTGPFWLRYFFYGRRRFVISGNKENKKSHGMLIFYDPGSGRKIITSSVVMPEIKPGNYVEKAMKKALTYLADSDRFDRVFQEVYKTSGYRDFPSYGDIEKFQQVIVKQLRTMTNRQGQQIYDVLSAVGRGRKFNDQILVEVSQQLASKESGSKAAFDKIVSEYNKIEEQESRRAKIQVYNSLRSYLSNAVTRLELSDVRGMLPSNLSKRSTVGKIYRQQMTQV